MGNLPVVQVMAGPLAEEVALAWARATPRSDDGLYRCRRLTVVRIFARHPQALDPATEVPPEEVPPHHPRRAAAHLDTPAELAAPLAAAARLSPALRALTRQTLSSLLAATGLRVSEACILDRGGVDLVGGVCRARMIGGRL